MPLGAYILAVGGNTKKDKIFNKTQVVKILFKKIDKNSGIG